MHVQREELRSRHQAAQKENREYPYDPLKPWNRCFEQATEGYTQIQYWYEQVERPAQMILAHSRTMDDYLDGDAVIAATSSAHIATSCATPADVGLAGDTGKAQRDRKRPGNGDTGTPPPKAPKVAPVVKGLQHNVTGRKYTTDRNGRKFCVSFQTAAGCVHGKKCQLAHQCNKCLLPTHAGDTCSQTHLGRGMLRDYFAA